MHQASQFELRHPWLLHNGLLLASALTYWIDRDDVVWHFLKGAPHAWLLEHLSFGSAAVLISLSILLSAWAARRNVDFRSNESSGRRRWGGVLYAVGLGTLLPLPSFLLFVLGELVRIARFESVRSLRGEPRQNLDPGLRSGFSWKSALVPQAALCCAFLSMAVFSFTLVDRRAEYLFAATAFVSVLAHFLAPAKAATGGE